jgi:hypothetical protein
LIAPSELLPDRMSAIHARANHRFVYAGYPNRDVSALALSSCHAAVALTPHSDRVNQFSNTLRSVLLKLNDGMSKPLIVSQQ